MVNGELGVALAAFTPHPVGARCRGQFCICRYITGSSSGNQTRPVGVLLSKVTALN